MKKALVAVALAGMLAAVAACGGSSSTAGTAGPGSADRDKFVGTWNGWYGCPVGDTVMDAMVIRAGSGDLGLSIQLHVGFANPDTVTGTLTSATEVNIPEQTFGGATGTAKLTLKGDKLDFSVTGMGMTCGGSDYTRVP